MRTLILAPIIHTQADLGSLNESVRRHHIRTAGREEWDRRVKAVDAMWRRIRRALEDSQVPIHRLRLYQDGLPNCGREEEIVADLARRGSENHRLLLELMAKGATLTGTESPELLVEEYRLARDALDALEGRASPRQARLDAAARANAAERLPPAAPEERSRRTLEQRDRYIARRIGETLQPGEIGLIFLGMLHSLEGYLPSDIKVRRLGGGPL